ncbi:MAG: IS66 family insertion sequence element accessory protein TnpA [Victivallales bacterium]
MGREGRDYWEEQLSEYWDSSLTIQEYSELKELSYESNRCWIRVLQKTRQDGANDSESLEQVEVIPLQVKARDGSGIRISAQPVPW